MIKPPKFYGTLLLCQFARNLIHPFQKILESQAPESAQKNINLKILSELKVIVPPIEKQEEFSGFVHQIDKLRFVTQKSLAETQQLFDSLMQKYFG